MKIIKISAVLVLAFIVWQLIKLYNFKYEFAGISFTKLTAKQMTGKLYLKIMNTSLFGLRIINYEFEILKDTQERIASISSAKETKVEPNGNSISVLDFNYNISPAEVIKDSLYFLNPNFMLLFKGHAEIKIFTKSIKVPVKFVYQHTPSNTP